MSIRTAMVKLMAAAAGSAMLGGGAVHVSEKPSAQETHHVKLIKGAPKHHAARVMAKRPLRHRATRYVRQDCVTYRAHHKGMALRGHAARRAANCEEVASRDNHRARRIVKTTTTRHYDAPQQQYAMVPVPYAPQAPAFGGGGGVPVVIGGGLGLGGFGGGFFGGFFGGGGNGGGGSVVISTTSTGGLSTSSSTSGGSSSTSTSSGGISTGGIST